MHEPVRSQLEIILRGSITAATESVRAHLAECAACAEELREMRHYSGIVRSLKAPSTPEPSAGFYARVMQRVESQGRPSFWSLLLDPVFGRRLVYATGAMFLLMASFLLATANEQSELARTPVQIMMQPPARAAAFPAGFGEDVQRDRESFLVTMATFSE